MSNFLTRLFDRAVVPQSESVPLVRPLSAIYEGGGFDTELVTQDVEIRRGRETSELRYRNVRVAQPRPSGETKQPVQSQPVRTAPERSRPGPPPVHPEREATIRPTEKAATVPAKTRDDSKASPPEPRIIERPAKTTARAPAGQPMTLQSVIDHIFREEEVLRETREPVQAGPLPVEERRDEQRAEAPPPLVSIGRIDISVVPPLAAAPRNATPPRSQGFAGYSRIRRGQER